jgi:hypothetical protein
MQLVVLWRWKKLSMVHYLSSFNVLIKYVVDLLFYRNLYVTITAGYFCVFDELFEKIKNNMDIFSHILHVKHEFIMINWIITMITWVFKLESFNSRCFIMYNKWVMAGHKLCGPQRWLRWQQNFTRDWFSWEYHLPESLLVCNTNET